MASGKPIVRQLSILPIIIQFIYMLGLLFVFKFVNPLGSGNVLNAMLVYTILVLAVRNILAFHHRKGIRYLKKDNYVQAIPEFLKSYDFFTKYNWIDKYRSIFLFSASRTSYKEMALINTAYCYSQSNNGKKSKEYYEKTLREFPESGMAKSALNFIKSFE